MATLTPRAQPLSDVAQKVLSEHDGVQVLAQTPQLIALHTIIRDRSASREDFIFYSDRLIRLLVEEGERRGSPNAAAHARRGDVALTSTTTHTHNHTQPHT
jgi:uracil phosphoribosyltransferase